MFLAVGGRDYHRARLSDGPGDIVGLLRRPFLSIMSLFDAISVSLLAYTAFGVLFAIPFFLRLAQRLDPDTKGATNGFRVLVLPGVIALWPWLLAASMRTKQPRERNAHEDAASEGTPR